jgi:drug/metabolite transporter (DMT)-like permease
MMFFVMLIGWILITVLFIAQGGWEDLQHITRTSLLGIAFLGIICSGLAYIAWYDVLQVLPATQVGAFLNIEPLITVLVAWLLLDEQILPIALVGGAIILIGVRLVQKPPPKMM